MVRIALPKGRLGERVLDLLERAGYPCPAMRCPSRKLVFENPRVGVAYFQVKPTDVPVYVERGAADLGIAGKDILLEHEPDVFELLDLHEGICRMCVAGKRDFRENPMRPLRVATKFPHIAANFYEARGRGIDIIKLNGSIELAPLLGLSDVIVDIVETGKTLAENGLVPFETIAPVSARLICGKVSYKFRTAEIRALARAVERVVAEKQSE